MSDAYEKNYMTDDSDTRWVKLAYANRLIEQAEQRITDLERRNGELEKALEHIYELGRNGAGLQCSMYAQEALTRTKEQK